MSFGVPFNIASYALLTQMIAQVTGLRPGDFVHTLGDAHLYLNHLEQARLQVSRAPLAPPRMVLAPEVDDLFAFKYDHFHLADYEAHPHIAAPIAGVTAMDAQPPVSAYASAEAAFGRWRV